MFYCVYASLLPKKIVLHSFGLSSKIFEIICACAIVKEPPPAPNFL
nr:MAG TPA: hypothetical protein [Bacteriophage sp.]